MTHIYAPVNWVISVSGNGLSLVRRHVERMLNGLPGLYFGEILIEMSSTTKRPFCSDPKML